jgi:hypothetical protein
LARSRPKAVKHYKKGLYKMRKLLISLAPVLAVVALALAPGQALAKKARFWTDKTETTLLRDVKSTPNEHQPDAGEFVNNGNIVLKTSGGLVNPTITCKEIEFGGAVVSNVEGNATLAVASGVAEGDECTDEKGNQVHTLFDTLASGAVGNAANGNVASVTVSGEHPGPYTATVNDLKWSFNDAAIGSSVWCTGNANGITGTVTNSEGPFTEEKEPNLKVEFKEAAVPVEGTLCPPKGSLTGTFFLETPSTFTDTVWVG